MTEQSPRMLLYYESKRLGRCDRCYTRKARPGRIMCGFCAKRHHRAQLQNLWKKLGLKFSFRDYVVLVWKQRNRCAVCGRRRDKRQRLHVDHDHKTLLVRGLLCGKCNRGIGMFNDSPELLVKASYYVAVTRAKSHLTMVSELR